MKRLFIILSLFLIACTKAINTPVNPVNKDIFSVPQSTITDGMDIIVNLKTPGVYTLTIGDSVTNQVLTRERFNGKVGENNLKIYTRSLSIKYLYLLLEDQSKTQIGKTSITLN